MPRNIIKNTILFFIVLLFQLLLISSCQVGECPICELNPDLSGKWNTIFHAESADTVIFDLTFEIIARNSEINGSYFLKSNSQQFNFTFSSPILGKYNNGNLSFVSADSLVTFESYFIPSPADLMEGTLKFMQKIFEIELKKI